MPVKEYLSDKIEFPLLRQCFKKQHLVIFHTKPAFKTHIQSMCELNDCDDEFLTYWTLNQAIAIKKPAEKSRDLPKEEQIEYWIELTHPIVQTTEPTDWSAAYDL